MEKKKEKEVDKEELSEYQKFLKLRGSRDAIFCEQLENMFIPVPEESEIETETEIEPNSFKNLNS